MENGNSLYVRIAELEKENEELKKYIEINLAVQKCPWCKVGACECDCDKCKITGCFECVIRNNDGNMNLCDDCEEDECETCCLTECACLVCKCCETKRSHYKEVCGDCGKCNGIDKGSNDFNTKCCECESDESEDESDDESEDDSFHPDQCVKCDCTFNQRKTIFNDGDCAKAWELHCDIGDDEGDLCAECLGKWEDERCSMCNSGEHFVPKEMMWPNHTDCVFCAEPEEYAKEKNISIKEAERIRKKIVADSPNGWEY